MKKNSYIIFILLIGWSCSKESSFSENLVVKLITPVNEAILDNGCRGEFELLEWYFDWEDFPSAQKYHLYVIHIGSRSPVIDEDNIQNSEYLKSGGAYIVSSYLRNWTWKVKAFVNDEWTEWSELRTFHVEPLNTDCN